MKTIEETRHARFTQLLDAPEYGSVGALAKALGRSPAQVSQWKNRSRRASGGVCNIDSESARDIERLTGRERGWMDSDPDRDQPAMSSMGLTVATWLDHKLPEDKRNRAFWLIHQMVFADEWPELSTAAPLMPASPSREPIEEREPSRNR